jgi:uncharacterized membrane protein YkvA (DUF1232 family)
VEWATLVISIVGAVLALWLALLIVLLAGSRDRVRMRDALRLLPDLVRLLARLAKDPAMPRRLHVVMVVLLVYLASPLDLVPDVIPVIGYLDDVVLVLLVLRWAMGAAGPEAIDRNWPGTPEGRAAVSRLLGGPEPGSADRDPDSPRPK